MGFSNYKNIGEVLKKFQVTYTEANFVKETEFSITDYFREDLEFMMREAVVDNSEFAVCENLIYPVIKEVWKCYHSKFILWSHKSLTCYQYMSGFSEYILAKRSPLGKVVFDKPYLLLVEAKEDNFHEGWVQCLVEMITAQRINHELNVTILGIVTNGTTWQFGKLEGKTFAKQINRYMIQDLDQLFAAVNYVFQECESQLDTSVVA
nr:hypothetical protein [Microcoleus sp. bin38.metabat.b11b12b14.051]